MFPSQLRASDTINATDDRVIHTNIIRAAQADVTRETLRHAESRAQTQEPRREDRQTDTDRRTDGRAAARTARLTRAGPWAGPWAVRRARAACVRAAMLCC